MSTGANHDAARIRHTRMSAELDFGLAPEHYRLPDAAHVGRVRLQVASIERSVAYYRDILGFGVISSEKGVAILGPGDDGQPLVELHERTGVRPVPSSARLGLYHFAILLPDRPSLGRFVEHLATRGQRAGSADHFVSESMYLWDPDGLGIEVYADRPRSQWRRSGRELVIVTEPLDLDSLARAAGGGRWGGLPAGTTIGHMHLQVGDLRLARSFYHAALGFDLTMWSYPGALFMSAGGYHHHLATNTWSAAAPRATDEDARLLEWDLVLPDEAAVQNAASSLRTSRHTVMEDDRDRVVSDPWGITLRLTTHREKSPVNRPPG